MTGSFRSFLIVAVLVTLSSGAGRVALGRAPVSRVQDSAEEVEESPSKDVHFDFEEGNDLNFDGWPDHWTRIEGTGYPRYIKIEIQKSKTPAVDDRYELKMRLDGGKAGIVSPRVRIDSRFSYLLEFKMRTFETAANEENQAWADVRFVDESGKVLQELESPKLQHVETDQTVQIGPLIPPSGIDCFIEIQFNCHPTRPSDLFGGAIFDDIRLTSSPKLLISSDQAYNIFPEKTGAIISCKVSGIEHSDAELQFQLFDVFGNAIGLPESHPLTDEPRLSSFETQLPQFPDPEFEELSTQVQVGKVAPDLKQEVTVEWAPSIQEAGFYLAEIRLFIEGEQRSLRTLTMAVVDRQLSQADQSFGWSLSRFDTETSLPALTDFLRQAGIRWVKYPVWYGKSDQKAAEWIAELAERLDSAQIQMVGVLDYPPEEHADAFPQEERGIASLFQDPDTWQPTLTHVLTRLSLKIHYWQLGSDEDLSFVGYPKLVEKLKQIRYSLSRFAKDIKLGINWHWLQAIPARGNTPWDFYSNSVEEPFTAEELRHYLSTDVDPKRPYWTTIQPLSKQDYSLETRVRDLVMRMIAVKIANGIAFVPRPFSDDDGLLKSDGTPGELFVPWRVTSGHLAGMTYLGKLKLPNGSENVVFANEETATMIVWNETETVETLYLGESVTLCDLWGKTESPGSQGFRQQIEVGRWPVFVTGLDVMVAKFRMNFGFDRERLASIFGQRQTAGIRFDNVFPRGASGSLSLNSEALWGRPIDLRFKAAAGAEFRREFPVNLQAFASTGVHQVRIDVQLDSERRKRFSVYREIEVGFGLIEMKHRLERTNTGAIVVHVTLVNNSYQRMSFDCFMLVPNQRRQRKQVMNLGNGRESIEFVIYDPDELDGAKVWLRAEEIRGKRVLNDQLTVPVRDEVVEPQSN